MVCRGIRRHTHITGNNLIPISVPTLPSTNQLNSRHLNSRHLPQQRARNYTKLMYNAFMHVVQQCYKCRLLDLSLFPLLYLQSVYVPFFIYSSPLFFTQITWLLHDSFPANLKLKVRTANYGENISHRPIQKMNGTSAL